MMVEAYRKQEAYIQIHSDSRKKNWSINNGVHIEVIHSLYTPIQYKHYLTDSISSNYWIRKPICSQSIKRRFSDHAIWQILINLKKCCVDNVVLYILIEIKLGDFGQRKKLFLWRRSLLKSRELLNRISVSLSNE